MTASIDNRTRSGRSRGRAALCAAGAACLLWCAEPTARAWEAATTHAGLTEQSALAVGMHQRLRDQLGLERGLFTALTVPPQDAPELFEILGALNPTHGYVPDRRGRLMALGWLAAGSVVADVPVAFARNHFLDPATGHGLSDRTLRGLTRRLRQRLLARLESESVPGGGVPAPDWAADARNPMGLPGFLDQYRKAIAAGTPGERSRHAAGALLAAGAILHVLQDMGSPSHVRDDLAAHLDVVGAETDRGSRLERVAAVAFGRLGVPAPRRVVDGKTFRGFFTSADGTGLADWTAPRFFSPYTLPRSFEIRGNAGTPQLAAKLARSLRRPNPAPLPQLDLHAARSARGTVLHDNDGVCLASYRMQNNWLTWSIDQTCLAEQAAVLLPQVGAYSAGLLGWLFRGQLELRPAGEQLAIATPSIGLGSGTLEVFWDDVRGVRSPLGEPITITSGAAGTVLAKVPRPPRGALRVAAVFTGLDSVGERVAAGVTSSYPLPKPETK